MDPISPQGVTLPSPKPHSRRKTPRDTEYGVLESRNINRVSFGDYEFNTWYGNSAYFLANGDSELGIDTLAKNIGAKRKFSAAASEGFWLDRLHVCEFCFKYTDDENKMVQHRSVCQLAHPFPPLGKLLYADMKAPYLVKKVRGFRHELFCQNLALFGKLFLDDKSVYYNVKAFDFYILYGYDVHDDEIAGSILRKRLKPMGFFSKEVNSWEADNNLACICIFPPYQRLGLGSLLIEFSYALAGATPGQTWSGPEFPLSPYGKVAYLGYWSKRLAFVLLNDFRGRDSVTLAELASRTGFRKDDILFTLEYMEVLQESKKENVEDGKRENVEDDSVSLILSNLHSWCFKHHISETVMASMMNTSCLLI